MIRQAVILSDTPPAGPAVDPLWLERLAGEARRHGVEDILTLTGGGGAVRDALPQPPAQIFLLDSRAVLDINLWDLALAAKGASALAVTADGAWGGAAVLDRDALGRLPDIGGSVFSALVGDPRLPKRVYDRPWLKPGAVAPRGAVIFDRDGVLNEDTAFAHRPEQIVWTPTAKAAVKAVNDAGLYAFVATNQSGVARGFYGEQDVIDLHRWMNAQLIAAGGHIDAFDYSPFHPDGAVEAYRRDSDCRKPGPRMLNRLIDTHQVDRTRTVMIGDRRSDVEAATAAGVEGLLFEGGDLAAFLKPVIARLTA